MTLLERINASGTTVVMATHEAGIVDQMQRRVIELSAGEVVRDERSAGYGQAAEDAEHVEPIAAEAIHAAAPKVAVDVMRDAQPLYVEPEEASDDVTDEAAAITAAATGVVPRLGEEHAGSADDADASTPAGRPASPVGDGATSHLTLAERLGLRAPGGPRAGDDEQEVGPVK
jgi:cell division transport system ATP-binding protein